MKNGTNSTETTEFSSPLEFPCDFFVKVMGKTNSNFEKHVMSIFKKHYPKLPDDAVSKRPSKDHNYLAITVKIYAESKQQLDLLYQDLSNEPSVLMAL